MLNKQKIISTTVLMACSAIGTQAQATLPDNAILKFDAGVVTCAAGAGTPPDSCTYAAAVESGSYFGMDTNGSNTVLPIERIPLVVNVGVTLGGAQAATGTHSGAPDVSESPGIDQAWGFFGNTGLHLTTVAPIVLTDDGAGNVILDFSGWSVSWNGIAVIPMGTDAWNGNTNGQAIVTCAADCAEDDTYVLDYSATVPLGDPSGFGGVKYNLHFEGAVAVPPLLSVDSGTPGPGSIAVAVDSADGRISMDDLLNNGGVADPNYSYAGGLVDFVVTGITGTTVTVVIPQTVPIPADSTYRKYINGGWTTFTVEGANLVASALAVAGFCPAVNNAAYNHDNGLVEGDDCVQLIIEDDRSYDTNKTTGDIADPGGVATAIEVQVDTRTSGTSGCSIANTDVALSERADWLLVAGFIVWLGLIGFRRNKTVN